MSTPILSIGAPKRIGFISTRFSGTDGVTLESRKWAQILTEMGHSCFWMAGVLDEDLGARHHVPLAYFGHPDVLALQQKIFGVPTRSRAVTNGVHALKE